MESAIKKLGAEAKQTYLEYALCDHCMGRTFAHRAKVSDHARLGKRLRQAGRYAVPKKCHVCKGVFDELGVHCDEMVRLVYSRQFSTFLIGATLKPSVLDADDNVRARYRLRGTQSAKSDITATLSKMFARRTHARATSTLPDITLRVDLRNSSVSVESRSIVIEARYTKESPGLPQKGERCGVCSGKGCLRCAYRGIIGVSSVEGKISEFLCDVTSSKQAKFLWCGSEDPMSTVVGRGRPIIVRLVCPSRRRAALPKRRNLKDGIVLHDTHYIRSLPKAAPKFSLTATMQIVTKDDIDAKTLRELRTVVGDVVDYGTKRQMRTIHSASYKKTGPREFWLKVRVDSGFPLRRFVECSNVSPNLSDLLGIQCKYVIADFADVDLVRERHRASAKS